MCNSKVSKVSNKEKTFPADMASCSRYVSDLQ